MNKKNKNPFEIKIPDDLLARWQSIVDIMAELARIPVGLIMRIAEEDIEVSVASGGKENPYQLGDRHKLGDSGLYCEAVLTTKKPLLIPDALSDPEWMNNPDINLNMISYLGFPILFPDGTPFGTICILDTKPNAYNDAIYGLLDNFRQIIEQHLSLLYMNEMLGEKNKTLIQYLDEIQSLRGLIRICAQCKKIKDSEGRWQPVEKYLTHHPEADLTHGYCPDCAEKILAELKNS